MPAKERFWAKVRKGSQCWEWTGCCSDTGYGNVYADGRLWATHRYSWLIHNGEIPGGLCVLHSCDNRRCVRPSHLFLGTKRENSIDMARKGRERVPSLKGEANAAARLTAETVLRIRDDAAKGIRQNAIARRLRVSVSTVSLIVRRRIWRHV